MSIVIAADGTAAPGNGTLGKRLARHFNFAHMDCGALYRLIALAGLCVFALSTSAAAHGNWSRHGVFDTPLREVFVPLKQSPNVLSPVTGTGRRCSYYSRFMVKEVDLGDMPVERLAIVPGANPRCDAVNAGERDLTARFSDSRFVGTRGPFAVFFDVDGHNGVITLAALNALSGEKLFEDTVEDAPGDTLPLTFSRATATEFVLRYSRGYVAPCVIGAGRACWPKVTAATGLTGPEPASCRATFAREVKGKIDPAIVQSVVFYDAEARYTRGHVSITPRSGVLRCRISD